MSVCRVYIAEKDSLADTIAQWLGRKNGQPVRKEGRAHRVGENVVIAASGHLLENAEPEYYDEKYSRWVLADLPILPPKLPFTQVPPAKSTRGRERLEFIGKWLSQATEVVHVGDPDDEGQAIVDNLLLHFRYKGPTSRLWAMALTDDALSTAHEHMRPNRDYLSKWQTALARSDADWLYGMNFTRAVSVALQERAGMRLGVFSVGRVQTATLGILVRRELEIRNFVPRDYFVPWVQTDTAPSFKATWKSTAKDEEDRLLTDEAQAQALLAQWNLAGHQAVVAEYSQKPGKESPPLPFMLGSLQVHCNKSYGMSAQETLDVAQELYQAKLTTYPRTDSAFMPSSMFGESSALLRSLAEHQALAPDIATAIAGADTSLRSRAWDDKKVGSHFAIMPILLNQENAHALASLTPTTKRIYQDVVRRFILQFYPEARIFTTEIGLTPALQPLPPPAEQAMYRARGKVYTSQGWRAAFGDPAEAQDEREKEPVQTFPALEKGAIIPIRDAQLDKKKTKPPARFTEASLLQAMEHAYKYVQDPALANRLKGITGLDDSDETLKDNIQAGIGTQATRASILERLKHISYLVMEKKELVPTTKGICLIRLLPDELSFPDQTALWQLKLDAIKSGDSGYREFMAGMMQDVPAGLQALINRIRAANAETAPDFMAAFKQVTEAAAKNGAQRAEVTDKLCPKCGKHLIRRQGVSKLTKRPYDLLVCEGAPECDYKIGSNDERTEHKCPKCGGHLLHKKGVSIKTKRPYEFFSCEARPSCDYQVNAVNGIPETEEQAAQRAQARAEREEKLKDAPVCAHCGKFKLLLRESARGPYWSCTGFFSKTPKGKPACNYVYPDLDGAPDVEKGKAWVKK